MREVDIAIVGGGLAGATAGAMLGRAGISALVIDPHLVYPPDFRCEKIGGPQVDLLRKTGLQDVILPAATLDEEMWFARYGRLVEKRPHDHYGILYDTLVNTMRAAIQAPAELLHAKVAGIAASADRQTVTLSNGEEISARLVVLATGLGATLRRSLGIERIELSRAHTVSIGFDVAPVGRPNFDFRALTYFPEHPGNQMAYLTFYPIGRTMRANYFTYRDMRDPWLREMRAAPVETLTAALPRLKKITGEFEVPSPVEIRPLDIYEVRGHRRSGVVLVGDAFSTSCPAVGMGVGKVWTDVERLCNVYIPRWLADPGMGTEKISAFYDDPVKRAADDYSMSQAFFMRSLYTDPGVRWGAQRLLRFGAYLSRGILRAVREGATPAPQRLQPATTR
jgi:2-polyprenyl-6-methoxyphenol hydroxylase-like FAD-dependent oxidoreductase